MLQVELTDSLCATPTNYLATHTICINIEIQSNCFYCVLTSFSVLACSWHLVMVKRGLCLNDLTSYAGCNFHVPGMATQVRQVES